MRSGRSVGGFFLVHVRGDLGKSFFKNKKRVETPGSGGRVAKHHIFQQ